MAVRVRVLGANLFTGTLVANHLGATGRRMCVVKSAPKRPGSDPVRYLCYPEEVEPLVFLLQVEV